MTLRAYEPGDLDAMHALDVLCFDPPFRFTRSAMRRFAEARHARVVIAEHAGDLIGFCIVQIETQQGIRAGYIVTLDVAPAYRRKGLARLLMQQAELLAAAARCGRIALHVFTGNTAAIAFYEHLGFTQSHLHPGFYGEGRDAFVYLKHLPRDPARDTIK